ncbi:hypothetical protein K0M31_016121 [Melipona bicolor]|uniref:Uncharacterized protein n=1 Tax=Melipona bicolor TaxID=60889 RepID=A0AA40G6S5_9HYME|nr:hypothetical protein K0M31_016121 [Melipona bicolor]
MDLDEDFLTERNVDWQQPKKIKKIPLLQQQQHKGTKVVKDVWKNEWKEFEVVEWEKESESLRFVSESLPRLISGADGSDSYPRRLLL